MAEQWFCKPSVVGSNPTVGSHRKARNEAAPGIIAQSRFGVEKAALAKALGVADEEMLYGPREPDPALPINVSAAYTGLDMEIAESVISMGYTSWIASRPDEARQAIQRIMPWLEVAQRRGARSAQARQGKHILARGHELLGALALDQLDNEGAIAHFRQALTMVYPIFCVPERQ